jgi:para-nitrobenzyl esterase
MGTIVETRCGKLEGRETEGVQVFRGIPYAKPPVGALRFRAPEPARPWSGVRSALEFGPSAPQQPTPLALPGMDVGAMDEDCLYLNVYTPALDAAARPVMVWIHGGGFVIGSSSQPVYDARPLAGRGDVVVVTLNYRIGPLGFLYLADLCPELAGATANAGIRDQLAALEWVRDNIAAFGGDPDNVTIFGESAGGMSVGTLLGMPSARGLFARAIAQSGASHNVHTRETATKVAARFLEELGIAPSEAAATLRELPPDKLLGTQQQTSLTLESSPGVLAFQPLVDGDSLPGPPLEAVAAGQAAEVTLITGTTRDEWNLFGMLDPRAGSLDEAGLVKRLSAQLPDAAVPGLVEAYRGAREGHAPSSPTELYFAIQTDRIFRIPAIRLAEAQQRHQPHTYLYRFDWETPAFGGALGACHAVDLVFVFGLVERPGAEIFTGGGPEAQLLSERVMDAWASFARHGDPSHAGLPGGRWDAYDAERRTTMLLGRECALEFDPAPARRRAWHGLL